MMTERHGARATSAPQGAYLAEAYAVRGSLIVASLESLRQLGHYDRYLQLLDPMWREQVMFCLASSWVPVEVALAHYAACDALQLSASELIRAGELVSERIVGPVLGALARSSRAHSIESSPWIPLHEYRRIAERLLRGGVVTVHELGEKEAAVELSGFPMLRFASFRLTLLAFTRQLVHQFTLRAFVKEALASVGSEQLRISVRWL